MNLADGRVLVELRNVSGDTEGKLVSSSGGQDAVIATHDDLFRIGYSGRWDGVRDKIEDEVEPLSVVGPEVHEGGFSFDLVGHWRGVTFAMNYPFTVSDFWSELADIEQTANYIRDEENREEAFGELVEQVSYAGGVAALQMSDLVAATQLVSSARSISRNQLSLVGDQLRAHGLGATRLVSRRNSWTVVFARGAPVTRAMKRAGVLRWESK
jgi:hypothetical protein